MMIATRKDNNIEIDVREMTPDEIDTSDGKYFCDDDTSTIYREDELVFTK